LLIYLCPSQDKETRKANKRDEWRRAMGQRGRTKRTTTFEQQLAEEARRFKEAAEREPPGSKARELLLRRARQAETAAHMSEWLSSPGLQPPKPA
jgi:hypothetical protein